MQIKKLENGNICLIFTSQEINQIKNETETKEESKFSFLGNKTKPFAEALYKQYGLKEFKLSDKKFKELRQKHFVVSIGQFLKQLQDKDVLNIVYKNTDGNVLRKRIASINFKSIQ
jgi:hypothetical protein